MSDYQHLRNSFRSGTAPWGGYLGKYLLQRPFIGGLICGIVFGDITQGILIGAAMQLVYIGYFNVGGVQSIDMGIISFPCVAIAMMSGIDTSAAIALATGLGALFTTLEMLCRTVFFPSAGALMKKGCEEADDRKIFLGYWVIPTGVYILTRGATSFLLMYFGADAVASVINMLPANIMERYQRNRQLAAVHRYRRSAGVPFEQRAGDCWYSQSVLQHTATSD